MSPRATLIAFIAGLGAAAALWFGTFFAQLGEPSSLSRWNHDIFERKQAVSYAMQGPRIVIAGGSNALYGIRARDLSRELGVPVMNAALHAGLGPEYYLHQLEKLVRPGDTLVLAFEYQMYLNGPDSTVMVDYMSAREPEYFRKLSPVRQVEDILGISFGRLVNPWLVKRHPPPQPDPAGLYADSYLDAWGDVLGNSALFKTPALRASVATIKPLRLRVDPGGAARIEAFAEWARANRIRVVATHPNTIDFEAYYARPDIRAKMEDVTRVHENAAIPFVDRYTDTLFDRRLFFDTVYHLDSVGATLRTEELAARLRPVLQGMRYGPPYMPVRSDHPLESADRNFRLWEPLAGFSNVDVPPGLGPMVHATDARAEFFVPSFKASAARFTARVRSAHGPQVIELLEEGKPIQTWHLDGASFQGLEAEVALHAGDNHFTLVQHGSSPDLVIAEWRFEPG
ncbi:MAG TPA: hypothetical protein VFE23_08075 [Usitatibacter sp.]|nr:hypothetical protein [Usitatibacter sp.]